MIRANRGDGFLNIDVDALVAPLDGESPCGEDLEYDPDFVELESLAKPKEEQQVGDSVIAAEAVDYIDVGRRALALLERTKDIRIAMILAEAVLHTEGYDAFSKVMRYVDYICENYWADVHPRLDEDDDNDPTMRVNALKSLVGTATVLRGVRWAPLTLSRGMGRFGLRHVFVAEGEESPSSDMESVPTTSQITAAFMDTDPAQMAAIRAGITAARESVKSIAKTFDEKVPGESPDLSALDKMLFRAASVVNKALGGDDSSGGDDAAASDGAPSGMGGGAARPASGGPMGAIASNDDVIRAIDRICEYYARYEPSSPVPLLMQRARKLVNADFMTIMRDMASAGVEQVSTISGIRDDEGY